MAKTMEEIIQEIRRPSIGKKFLKRPAEEVENNIERLNVFIKKIGVVNSLPPEDFAEIAERSNTPEAFEHTRLKDLEVYNKLENCRATLEEIITFYIYQINEVQRVQHTLKILKNETFDTCISPRLTRSNKFSSANSEIELDGDVFDFLTDSDESQNNDNVELVDHYVEPVH